MARRVASGLVSAGAKLAVGGSCALRAGFGLAGTSIKAQLGLWGLTALGLTGGAFSALAVFYITDVLNLPSFYLGPFMATEATGLILGSLALSSEAGREWKGRLWLGLLGSGVLLPPCR